MRVLEAVARPASEKGYVAPDNKALELVPKGNSQKTSSRLGFLDWTRGVAVAIMLQGHVFHSFSKQDLRTQGPFVISQFLGGIGPAVFLVLTGITLAFLMDRRQHDDLAPSQRWGAALRRAGYLLLLAFLFRLQLWAFAYPQSPWTDLLKVDVLNCMGFSILLLSIMAIFTTADRVRLCAVLGAVIAGLAPVVSSIDWSWMPPQLSAYFVPSYAYFAFFPWASFIAFGMSIGSLVRLARPEQMNRVMQWGTLAGIALILGGQYFSNFPYSIYPKSEFWLDSPGLIVIKLGVVLLIMAFAYIWNEYAVKDSWSWVRQFGTTSLLVYWVHIELVYGRWFGWWKERLSNTECVFAAIAVFLLMLALSVLRTRWKSLPFPSLFAPFAGLSNPRRVSGD
ncbi:MAG: heparan-alpha-glucosaminide N-acetyltransferase domain-containing protein [Acidobacteriota bacterium]|nr:heparan-alpha-glucosaminide N-acetyltransferase domain-containing protein [Acidobacteriota bacterium]